MFTCKGKAIIKAMTIKELKKELERFDENEMIFIEYKHGNGNGVIVLEIKRVYWDCDRDGDDNIIIQGL